MNFLKKENIKSFEEWRDRDFDRWLKTSANKKLLIKISRVFEWKDATGKAPKYALNEGGLRFYTKAWSEEEWSKLLLKISEKDLRVQSPALYNYFTSQGQKRTNKARKLAGQELSARAEQGTWPSMSGEEIVAYLKKNKINKINDMPRGLQEYLRHLSSFDKYETVVNYFLPKASNQQKAQINRALLERRNRIANLPKEMPGKLAQALSEIKASFPRFSEKNYWRSPASTWFNYFQTLGYRNEFRLFVHLAYGHLSGDVQGTWKMSREEVKTLIEKFALTHEDMEVMPDFYRLVKGKLLEGHLKGSAEAYKTNEKNHEAYYENLPLLKYKKEENNNT